MLFDIHPVCNGMSLTSVQCVALFDIHPVCNGMSLTSVQCVALFDIHPVCNGMSLTSVQCVALFDTRPVCNGMSLTSVQCVALFDIRPVFNAMSLTSVQCVALFDICPVCNAFWHLLSEKKCCYLSSVRRPLTSAQHAVPRCSQEIARKPLALISITGSKPWHFIAHVTSDSRQFRKEPSIVAVRLDLRTSPSQFLCSLSGSIWLQIQNCHMHGTFYLIEEIGIAAPFTKSFTTDR